MSVEAAAGDVGRRGAPRALAPGACIDRWRLSAEAAEHYPGTARPMPDTIDYRFVNGWVDTGDLPCRQAWREATCASLAARGTTFGADAAEPMRAPPCDRVYLGGEDERVDLSSFRYVPTLATHWARTVLVLDVPGELVLGVATCGTLDAWIGGEHRLGFAPCTRNHLAQTSLTVRLGAGRHELAVRFADLHERDTEYGFRLRLLAGTGVATALDAAVDETRLDEISRAVASLRTERLIHEGGSVRVVCDDPPEEAMEMALQVTGTWTGSTTMRVPGDAHPDSPPVRFALSRAAPGATLFAVPPLHAGCVRLRFAARVGEIGVERTLGATLLPPPLMLSAGATLAERKRAALDALVERGADGPSRALALLARGADDAQARAAIDALLDGALAAVRARHDCADFQLMPLLWIRLRHAHRLRRARRDALDDALLGFRYWLDEPGDDVMWFWSENHVLCFQVARYLAGTLFAERTFVNSGLTGSAQAHAAERALGRWFDAIDEHGLGEWNSSAYYPIDLLGLLTLAELAEAGPLVRRARALCDRIFVMTALHTLGGAPSGSEGRSYEKELLSGPANELGSVAAIAFGGPWYPGHDRAAVPFALSGYAPPAGLARLIEPAPGEVLETRYRQGLDGLGRLALWKCRHAQLSAVVDHGSGRPGHQQHLVDVRLHGHPMARLWVNHPGELKVWGEGRPAYWAGNGRLPRVAVDGRRALLLYDLGDDPGAAPFTHAFCPREACDEILHEGDWLFARAGDGYAGLCSPGGAEALANGAFAGSEWRRAGRCHAWLVVAGGADIDGDFARFRTACRALSPRHDAADGGRLRYDDAGVEVALGFLGPLTRAGVPVASRALRPDGYLALADAVANGGADEARRR